MIIRFVLDAGAVAAYARRSENLGELLSELADEVIELDADLGFEIPAACLPAAVRADPKAIDTIRLLAAHSLCRVRNPDVDRWMSATVAVGDVETAAVAVAVATADAENRAALDGDDAVYLVTTEPRRYQTPTLDGLTIIPIQR
jgi:hypothetical protein